MKLPTKIYPTLAAKVSSIHSQWNRLTRKQKNRRIITAIVLLAIIIVVADWFSPKNIVGIDRQVITKTVRGENLYDAQTFGTVTTTKSGPASTVTVSYPTTGDAKLDTVIADQAVVFANLIAKTASQNESYNHSSYVYGKKIYVTFNNSNAATTATPFKTLGFTQKGVFDESLFSKEGYENIITDFVSDKLNVSFGLDKTLMVAQTKEALASKDYRLAANGLVIQFATKKLPTKITEASFYEVLVPIELIKDFLE